jgi:hypothetical protein
MAQLMGCRDFANVLTQVSAALDHAIRCEYSSSQEADVGAPQPLYNQIHHGLAMVVRENVAQASR